MHAVVIAEGGALEWSERPDPDPGARELLVAVRAAGVNTADLMQREGFYPSPPGWPADIPGMELAGEVVSVGHLVDGFERGDRVMAVVGAGAQAELALVDAASAMRVPDSVSWEEAGGFPEAYSTAYDALLTQCALTMGERLLVTGAAGGVGTAAVQLGVAAGASVTASVRSPAKRDSVMALGADQALDPKAALHCRPFDVAIELTGGPSLSGVIEAMGLGGRIAVIGVGGGASADVDLYAVMRRRLKITGSTLRARSLEEKALVARAVERHVVPLLASGRLRVPVFQSFELQNATAAYQRFADGTKFGKIVLSNSSTRVQPQG